jgi:hypothetical protein
MMQTITVQKIIEIGQQVAKVAPYYMTEDVYDSIPERKCIGRQGDVYFWKLAALPQDIVEVTPYAQLAPGQTLGSRHCLASIAGVRMFQRKDPGPLDGPILLFAEPGTVTHPTHGDIVNIPAGAIIRITYQQMYANTVRRAID